MIRNARLRPGWWSLAALIVASSMAAAPGCSGGAASDASKPVEQPAPAPANPETPAVTTQDLERENDKAALVPSPMETQRALEASGIQTQLATLIPKHEFDMADGGTDHAAVRTGVVLADLLLTTKGATKDEIVGRLQLIGKGMEQLGGGEDIQSSLRDFADRVKTDAVTRDELLKEFDELSGVVIPELKFNGKERVVPLIEAGSWLEGANLVAKAVKAAPDRSAAEKLLKAPSVVDYFIKYVETEGADKAPEAVTQKLREALGTLKGLAEKTEALTVEDIDTVIHVTDDVLALM
jgi:hypothetical protein